MKQLLLICAVVALVGCGDGGNDGGGGEGNDGGGVDSNPWVTILIS